MSRDIPYFLVAANENGCRPSKKFGLVEYYAVAGYDTVSYSMLDNGYGAHAEINDAQYGC